MCPDLKYCQYSFNPKCHSIPDTSPKRIAFHSKAKRWTAVINTPNLSYRASPITEIQPGETPDLATSLDAILLPHRSPSRDTYLTLCPLTSAIRHRMQTAAPSEVVGTVQKTVASSAHQLAP